jgi:hypothetical protein
MSRIAPQFMLNLMVKMSEPKTAEIIVGSAHHLQGNKRKLA